MVGINEIRPALEAILFAAGDSVETERIAKVLGAEPWDVRQAAEQLAREYEENGHGFRLARMENRLQLVTAGEYSDVVSRTLESARSRSSHRRRWRFWRSSRTISP